MRIFKSIAILALVLAPAAAYAQSTDTPMTTRGFFDLGARGTTTTGEPARYERFRDLKDGLFFETFRLDAEKNGWLIKLGADHMLAADQKYTASFVKSGTFKANGSWDQIPFLMSQTTQTPYLQPTTGQFILDDTQQKAWQALSATAPAGGFAPRYVAFLSAVTNSPKFSLEQKRHTAGGGAEYILSDSATFKVNAKHTTREGAMPYGAYLGTEIELPQPINQTMNDVDASVEAVHGIAIFRVGYTGSWFNNNADPTVFDNPAQLTDIATASGRGRLPRLAQNSTRFGVNGMVSLKMAHRSRLTVYGTMATLKDGGESVIPFTINSAATAVPLFRDTVQGKAVTTAANVTFSSRPTKTLNFVAKYRYFDYDNQTPAWTNTAQVRYDSSFQSLATAPSVSEIYSLKRNNLDADLYLTPAGRATFSVGASRNTETRNDRIYTGNTENVVRAKVDVVGQSFLTLRSIYEYSQRRGEGFDSTLLPGIGEQPLMRHYDIADRNRNRLSLVASLMANANWGLNLSAATGKDDYLNSTIGLRDNNNKVYTAGITGTPTEQFTLGVSYSYEDYKSKQMNNTASATAVTDLSKYFSTAGDDKVHSLIANADIVKIADKVDLHFSYDFNQSDITYVFGTGDPVTTTLAAPVQLPAIKSDLTRGTADLVYHVTPRVSLGVSYWYDKYSVTDFTLDSQAQDARVPGNYMLLGYSFEPYTAQTVWTRVMVRW